MARLLVYDAYENKVYTYSNLRENDPMPYMHGNNLLQEINIHLILLTVKQQILINAKIYPLAYAFFKISVNTLGCLLKAIFFYQ